MANKYVNDDDLRLSLEAVRDRLVIKDKTEAQALVLSKSYPGCVYYTIDTHCVVVNGQVYGRGEQLPQVFEMIESAARPGSALYNDHGKVYLQPVNENTVTVRRQDVGEEIGTLTLYSLKAGWRVRLTVRYAHSVSSAPYYTLDVSEDAVARLRTFSLSIGEEFVREAGSPYAISNLMDAILDISYDGGTLLDYMDYRSDDTGGMETSGVSEFTWIDMTTVTGSLIRMWAYNSSQEQWMETGSFDLGFPSAASAISYDLTETPDLGEGDVQSAIEALDGKAGQLSLDTMGEDDSGEHWEDMLHDVRGYSELGSGRRIGANYAGTATSGYYVFVFPSGEGDVWRVEKAAGSGQWEGFWKGGTAYSALTAANHLQSWQQASGTYTAPAGTTLFAVVTNTASLNLTNVWKRTVRQARTPADTQRRLIEMTAGVINTSALAVGSVMPYWAAASTYHGVRVGVRKGQVLLLDLVGSATYAPLVFTDKDRVITEIHQSPVYGAFEAPDDGYAYIQKLISHDTSNYLYVMGYGGHAKDMADSLVRRDALQAQFDALYQKGVADGSGMASIVGLGYNIFDYITGAVDMAGFEYGVNYRKENPTVKVTASGKWSGNQSLFYFPDIDLSTSTTLGNAFYGCTNLACVKDLNTPLATGMNAAFANCSKLQGVGDIDGSAVVSGANGGFRAMFEGCTSLKKVGKMDTSYSNNIYRIFYNCSSLERVEELNFRRITPNVQYVTANTLDGAFYNCTKLRYILIKEIGTPTSVNSYNLSRLTVWGIASAAQPDARESLTGSLITYIKDRVSANEAAKQAAIDAGTYDEDTWTDPYAVCTITLAANTKALLTTEEIEQITAKGYTIV